MFKIKSVLICLFLLLGLSGHSQAKKIKISGKVVEKTSGNPMEYVTITLKNSNNPSDVTGGITNTKGEFNFSVNSGVYDVTVEFISFEKVEFKQKSIAENTNFGTIKLGESTEMLNEVKITTDRPMVEIKLDKKVYNVGKDMTVRGGTASDVLDNVPSVQVDSDGSVSLRGNSDVRILVDGRPITAANINDALRQIPADALDKVEVVTNPSARYDSEGGGGVLNIILKKGKNQGVNGSVVANGGLSANKNDNLIPSNQSLTANINYKTGKMNWFTTVGVFDRNNPGNVVLNSQYLDSNGNPTGYIDQRNYNERQNDGSNVTFGADWDINKSVAWSNTFNYRGSHGANPETVTFYNYDANRENLFTTSRFNDQYNTNKNFDYNTNFVKKFKKEGHKLTINGTFADSREEDNSSITTYDSNNTPTKTEATENAQKLKRGMAQLDYVLPFGKQSQFEAGYKGDFNTSISDYKAGEIVGGTFNPYPQFTNTLEYLERINALYSQVGTKVNKFSYQFGLRWENTNNDINQLATSEFHKKAYNNFFPSAFVSYEKDKQTSFSFSYSKRVSRPRGRQINPFSSYSSNINFFRGNPDLNPAYTDAYELGMMKTWSGFTLNSSVYARRTTGAIQFVRTQAGVNEDGIPITITTPINLSTNFDSGFEFNLNYTPFKWWRLNSNFNLYRKQTDGEYSYLDSNNQIIVLNYDRIAYSWNGRLTSKVVLPYKIDWQTNMNYNAPENNAQGKSIGVFSANIAFSKDVLKDKGTIAFNVQDLFNSRKRIFENNLPGVNSYFEMRRQVRQFNLSFTYRFNKKKGEKERPVKREESDEMGGF